MNTPEIHLPPASEYSGTGRFGFSAQVAAATPFPNIGAAQSLRQLGRQTVNEQCHAEPLTQNEIDGADDVAAASEKDPHGLDQHQSGAKLDAGKVRPSLVLNGFADALAEVFEVAEYGAQKYTPYGWREVADGETRYNDAKLRHQNAAARGEVYDQATGLRHAAHEAWNALAVLQLQIEADRARK